MTDTAAAMQGLERRQDEDRRGTARFVAAARDVGSAVVRSFKPPKLSEFEQAFLDLIETRRAGHMGKFEYSNGGMKLWEEFLKKHANDYYVPNDEQVLIERFAYDTASILKEEGTKKVTLVSRGPGTKFAAKEGALVRAFKAAGIEVAKVIYLDVSAAALRKSKAEGMEMLPDAEHETYQADIFDPATKNLYKVVGTEVGTCLGLTPFNAEGSAEGIPPTSSIEENMLGMRGQMKRGGHFITTGDHNDNKKSIEAAYAGQEDFARHMLEHHLGWEDTSDIKFSVDYNEQSETLRHALTFTKERTFEIGGREKTIPAGMTYYFNNSVKLSEEETVKSFEHSGFAYATQPKVARATGLSIGYHHLKAA